MVTRKPCRFVDGQYIAVLGFAEAVDWKNKSFAYHAGRLIAKAGYGTLCGNVTSTFEYALLGAKEERGLRQIVVEQGVHFDDELCSNIYVTADKPHKHRMLLDQARAAIVIGGGNHTRELADRLVALNKPVVAIEGSGGVTRTELSARVEAKPSALQAVNWLMKRLSF